MKYVKPSQRKHAFVTSEMKAEASIEVYYRILTFVNKQIYPIRLLFWIGLYYYNKEKPNEGTFTLWQYIKNANK